MTTLENGPVDAPVSEALVFAAGDPGERGRRVVAGADRRRRPTPPLSRYAMYGGARRTGGRRPGESDCAFVDEHGSGLFLAAVAVIALNFLDAWFTVLFLSHGGEELNPIMDAVIRSGTVPFILAKSVGIGVCVAVLTVAKNFRFARIGMAVVLVGYTALLGWHFWLYSQLS